MRRILLEHRDHGPDRERLEAVIGSGKNPAEACVGVVLLSVDRSAQWTIQRQTGFPQFEQAVLRL